MFVCRFTIAAAVVMFISTSTVTGVVVHLYHYSNSVVVQAYLYTNMFVYKISASAHVCVETYLC